MSVFNWRTEPRSTANDKQRGVVLIPNSVKFNSSTLSGSIATPEKTKTKPGVGKSATS